MTTSQETPTGTLENPYMPSEAENSYKPKTTVGRVLNTTRGKILAATVLGIGAVAASFARSNKDPNVTIFGSVRYDAYTEKAPANVDQTTKDMWVEAQTLQGAPNR